MSEEGNAPGEAARPAGPVATTPAELAARREALRQSVGDVAQRLKLSRRQIEALESGDWAALPGAAFARGALRGYGRLLSIDVSPLVAQIGGGETLRPTATLRAPLPRSAGFPLEGPGAGRSSFLRWSLAAIVGIAVLALFFGRDGDLSGVRSWVGSVPGLSGSASPAAPTAADAEPRAAGDAPAPAVPGIQEAPGATPPPLMPSAPGATPRPLVSTGPAAAGGAVAGASTAGAGAPGAAAAGATAPGAGSAPGGAAGRPDTATPAPSPQPAAEESPALRLLPARDAWVEVRDAGGRVLFSGMARANEPRRIAGTPPLSIVVGNASQVQAEWRGAPVELKPRARDGVARLKLD